MLTREPELALPFRAALLARVPMAEIVAMPVTALEAADEAALTRAARELATYDVVAFASAYAVAKFSEAMQRLDPCMAWPAHTAVWAVGPKTQAALQLLGWPAARAELASATDLAQAMIAMTKSRARVLLPQAEGGRPEAAALLRAAGHVVDVVAAYRSRARASTDFTPPEHAILEGLARGDFNYVAVFAPSQLDAVLAYLDAHGVAAAQLQLQWLAIGRTTGAACLDRGLTPLIARQPTPAALAALIPVS